MAICMIALFLVGSLFTLFGKMGEDMISVFAYLVSEENLGQTNETILFGDVKKYLNKCFNGDGDILSELGFNMDSMKNFPVLKNAELQLNDIEEEFKDKQEMFVYKEYLSELDKEVNYKSDDLSFVATSTNTNPFSYKLKDLLNSVNNKAKAQSIKETWDISSTSTTTCIISNSASDDGDTTVSKSYHPKNCWPTNRHWVRNIPSFTDELTKLNDFKELVELAGDSTSNNGIKKILNGLGVDYKNFLNCEINTITIFKKAIQSITNITLEVSGEDEGIFSFINCKFINSNMQIILVNLKNAFGGDLYMIGIYLLMAAFSLAFAISFTILLTVILKTKFPEEPKNDKNKQNNQNNQKTDGNDVVEYPMNTSEGRFHSKKQ